MTENKSAGCVQAAEGPILTPDETPSETNESSDKKVKEKKMQVTVGKEAPDFGATAYHNGGFTNIKLSDFRGKWVFLCFYPGDFTFV